MRIEEFDEPMSTGVSDGKPKDWTVRIIIGVIVVIVAAMAFLGR